MHVAAMRLLTLLLTTAALALAGCSKSAPHSAAAPSAVLRIGNGAEPQDLDPQVMTAFTDQNIALALFEGLCALDEKTSAPVPAAAERWEVSADGLVWTFHLRANLQWSDGSPLTAGDFVASWRRALAPQLAAEYSYLLFPLKNAEAIANAKADPATLGAEATDDHTLRLTLARPTPYLPALTANPIWFPVPPRVLEQFGATAARGTAWTRPGNLVGNGPFTLKIWEPNARVEVVRNAAYWDAATVRLERIVFFPTENMDVDERNFRAGQVDITNELPLAKVDTYRKTAPESLRLDPFLETFFLRFNTTRPPLNDARVRRALSLAIDREQLARTLLRGTRAPAPHYTPPDCAGYTAEARVPHDVAAAKALLAAAGFPDGENFPTLDVQIKNDELHAKTLEAIQAMWARDLGVHVTLSPMEQKTWVSNQQSLNYAISSARWVGDFVDPVTFLDMFVGGGSNNWTGWTDRDYDAAIETAAAASEPAPRYAAFQRAEARLLDAAPIAPVFFGVRSYLISPTVKGWEPALLGFHQYKKVYLAAP
ncbi:MAG: peptide ABC transporter substrate-binding protein [Candidatus Didemnitutus sp.]|nr:peptide ABC transporter substrate-binding protein [Candidatus Didemnitutus sp.]